MAWLWNTWQDYLDGVNPVCADSIGLFNLAKHATLFEAEGEIYEAVDNVEEALRQLHELGFTGRDSRRESHDESILDQAHGFVIELVHAGETLLLYHKRLAQSDASYGFLSQHDMVDHWDRYAATKRIFREIDQLVTDTNKMLAGFYSIKSDDEKFLTYDLDLPSELGDDFRIARNLFSIGADEVGVFLVGRGLERVLRRIAQLRRINIVRKGQTEPACETELNDLIEVIGRLRWKRTGARLINKETKALLHYLRELRNSTAHPREGKTQLGPREIAKLGTETANQLWKEVSSTRAQFADITIQRAW